MPSRRLFFTLTPVVVLGTGFGVLTVRARVPEGQIAPGVRVAELRLGGKSQDEARAALEQLARKRQAITVALRFAQETGIKRTWKPNAAKLGLGLDLKEALDSASKAGRTGLIGQISEAVTGPKQVTVPLRPTVDENRLRAYLKRQIAVDANRPAQNARLILAGGRKTIREKPGVTVDVEGSLEAIKKAWFDFNVEPKSSVPEGEKTVPDSPEKEKAQTPPAEGEKSQQPAPASSAEEVAVELVAKTVAPKITAADLQQIDGDLGSFSTHFGGTGANRGSNIALAAGRINGTILAPGEVFSYNKVVGPRVASAGFKDAPVIIKGELVPGIGGGICQVSSTLYNAALMSDLKIVRRSHHAFPVHYLPAGRDATVVDGSIDFQFQNSTEAPIYIAASARGGRLLFAIKGKKKPGREVSIQLAGHTVTPAPTTTVRDSTLPAGKRVVKDSGHRGHRVTVYRVVKENGEVVKKEVISRDFYRTFPAVVLVGTAPPKVKPVVPNTPQTAPVPGTVPPPGAPGQ